MSPLRLLSLFALSCFTAAVWYPFDGSNGAWRYVGSAGYIGSDVVRLTPATTGQAGAVWFWNTFYIENWDSTFDVRLSSASNPPADGMCIILQNDPTVGTTSIGGAGGGMGYAGIAKSVAICIDTYSGTGPNWMGTGTYTNGGVGQTPPFLLQIPIADGNWYNFKVSYRRASGYLTFNVNGNGYTQDFSTYIGDMVSTAGLPQASRSWFGVSGATGGAWANQDIRGFNWSPICPTPTQPTDATVTLVSGSTYSITCKPGLYGTTTTRSADPATCAYSGTNPTCTTCPAGSYCPGTGAAILCPAGYYGSSTGLSSNLCSGLCTAGYLCPSPGGSISATLQVCGGTGTLYCPAGSSVATTVSANYYTGPLTSPASVREWQTACPAGRTCTNGVVLDGVSFGSNCPNGGLSVSMNENTPNIDVTGSLAVTTPGYSGAVNYTLSYTTTGSCLASRSVYFKNTTNVLAVNSIPLDATFCSSFAVTVTASRTADNTLFATCRVNVSVLQIGRQPVIVDCLPRNVSERSIPGTPIGAVVKGAVNNTATTLLWSVDDVNSYGYVDACTGQVRVRSQFFYNTLKNFTVPLRLSNSGLPPLLSTTCNLTVTVLRVNQLPTLDNTDFFVNELSNVGVLVGQLTATDPDGDAVSGWNFTGVDSPNAFTVNKTTGMITVSQAVLDVILKSTYTYTVSFTDGYATVSQVISITLKPVPRPPTTFDQSRTISEGASPRTLLGAALNASHPQRTNYTFIRLSPNNTFDIFPNGSVYLVSNAVLDYNVAASYSLSFTVQDFFGLIASGILTVTVTEVNKAPKFCCSGSWAMGAYEGANPGAAIGNVSNPLSSVQLSATDPNTRDYIKYMITAVNPPQAASLFTLNALSGAFTVAAGVPTGALWYDPAWTWPLPQTAIVNVTAIDSGSPTKWDNGTVTIKIVNVVPRLTGRTTSVPANANGGTLLDVAVAWSPYTNGIVAYDLMVNDKDLQGRDAFTINATGAIFLASFSGAPPAFDYNIKSKYNVTVRARDINGNNVTAVWFILLNHVNRAPVWKSRPPTMYAAALTSGNIGLPLAQYVYDADNDLGIGENITFRFRPGGPSISGNTDSTFGITLLNGQLYVALNNTPSFAYPQGALVAPTYNMTIEVMDAGIDGPVYIVPINVTIQLTINQIPPVIGFFNLSVPEHSAPGMVVATVSGSTVNVGYKLTYSLQGAGPNAYAPFPFNITTSLTGTYNQGVIRVTPAASIEFWGQFRMYQALLSVTDNNPVTPLTTSTLIEIWVTWVQEPPFFNTGTKAPNSTTFVMQVSEHADPGTNVTLTPSGLCNIVGYTKDPWQTPLLTYKWLPTSGAAANLFTINSVTGCVTVSSSAGNIQYNVKQMYTLYAQVKDSLGWTDTATVQVQIMDVNDPAVYSGVFSIGGANLTATGLSVYENASLNTILGYVKASDPDNSTYAVSQGWHVVNFATQSAGSIGINMTSGAVMLQTANALDFWDMPSFWVTAAAYDGVLVPSQSLVSYYAFKVNVLQVNTVAITGFSVPSSVPANNGANTSSMPGDSATGLAAADCAFTTRGGTAVYIHGKGFGRTARRLLAEGATSANTIVTATYGRTGVEYQAASCSVEVANTLIKCFTVAGVGGGLIWRVTVDGWTATSVAKTSYFVPQLANIVRSAAPITGWTYADQALITAGENITVDCVDCGPVDTPVTLKYGRTISEHTSPGCSWLIPQSRLMCRTSPGIGANLTWQLTVGGQSSGNYNASSVHYAPPTITNINSPFMDTAGRREIILISGTNFGPAGTTEMVVQYSSNFALAADGNATVYTAVNCSTDTAHTRITCMPNAGIGCNLRVLVSVAGQSSPLSSSTLCYRSPTITDLQGAAKVEANTVGGQQLIISGTQFGPITPLTSEGLPFGPTVPYAVYGHAAAFTANTGLYIAVNCFVAVAGSKMVCSTSPGTGADLVWRVVVGNQSSPVFLGATTSYHPPIVSSYSPVLHPETAGGELVAISGQHFGPAGTTIDSAVYGPNGTEFRASNCTLITPHTLIYCYTSVGAGSGLKWFVTIDGQVSVTPSTAYHAPQIDSFSGTGTNSSTDGGDLVVLVGKYFSIDKYLDYVTYGPAGVEYAARNCSVTRDHYEITCATIPGAGRHLRWVVSVGAQHSDASSVFTSYAVPLIHSVTPAVIPTTGGIDVVIEGSDFALAYAAASVSILFNARAVPVPPQEQMDAYYSLLYTGTPEALASAALLTNVTTWFASLQSFLPTRELNQGAGVHQLGWRTPPGFGHGELIVVVNDVPSVPFIFPYADPYILSVAPDRHNVPVGFLRLVIDGANFCDGVGCGVLYVNNVSFTVESWSDTTIVAAIPDLPPDAPEAALQIQVGNQLSNVKMFLKPVPAINALVSQGNWVNMLTVGGQQLWVAGVGNIGMEPINITIGTWQCTNITRTVDNGKLDLDPTAEFTVRCITPPGVGSNLPVIVTSVGGSSRALSIVSFSYAGPTLTGFVNASVPSVSYTSGTSRLPTLGGDVIIQGFNFGLPSLVSPAQPVLLTLDDSSVINITSFDQTTIRATLPPGDGTSHFLRFIIAGNSSDPLLFSYASPSVASISPTHGPTVGGTVITIKGSNFGVTVPTVWIGTGLCVPLSPFLSSPNHDTLQCTTPYGQGMMQGVSVIITGQSSTRLPLWSYDPARVTSIIPASGPTSGRAPGMLLTDGVHRSLGPRLLQSITGTNLGRSGTILFQPSSFGDPFAVNVTVPADFIVSWNDTRIVFNMPEGFGYGLEPRVFADQWSVPSTIVFNYDLPIVQSVLRQDKRPYECQSFEQCFSAGNLTRCRTAYMGCFPTKGGFLIEIVGESFGPQTLLSSATFVYIGAKLCNPVRDPALLALQSHTSVICQVAAGVGEDLPVRVQVGGRPSSISNLSRLSFDPPYVSNIMPNQPDALGTQVVNIKGWNFGTEATPLSITVNQQECESEEWLNDNQLRCKPPAQVVGAKNLSITVANRTSPYTFFDLEEAIVYLCASGFYGLDGEECLKCPTGGKCPGGERYIDLVNATAGYWRSNASIGSDESSMCDVARTLTRALCPVLRPCEPVDACLGDNVCADGYDGERCALCLKGQYYRMNGECVKCPDSVYALYIGLALILLFCIGVAYYLNKKNISLALISIGVDYMQVLSMFARSKVKWPAVLKKLLTYFQAFNLSIEITAPECLVPDLAFYTKWFAVEAVPLAAATLLVAYHFGMLLFKRSCYTLTRRQLYSHVAPLVSTGIVLFRLLYLYLTKTSFDVLNCTPTDPPEFKDPVALTGPIEYMSGIVEPGYVCWEKGSWQVFLFPFGLATLALYSFGLPLLAVWFLRANREAVKTDQILRAKGLGDDTLSNPRFYEFRRMWHKLYYHFLPGKWYWEFVIAARKLGIAGTSLAFRQVPSYQLAIALLILFAAYVVHVVHRPYMTHTAKVGVIEEHEKKAMYDSLHMRIENDMREAQRKNFRDRKRANVFQQVAMRQRSTAENVVLKVFDANTVEAILLAASILICLAGICFDSKRFADDNMQIPRVQHEMLGFTVGCLVIIFLSLLYYTFVLVVELSMVLCPESVPIMMNCVTITCRMNRRKAARANGKTASKLASAASSDHGAGGQSDMVVNPAMLRTFTKPDANNPSGDAGVVDINTIQQIVGVPSPAMWQAVQSSYAKLHNLINDLRAQLQSNKKEQEANSMLAPVSNVAFARNPLLATKQRTQFTPRVAAEDNPAAIPTGALRPGKSSKLLDSKRTSFRNPAGLASPKSPASASAFASSPSESAAAPESPAPFTRDSSSPDGPEAPTVGLIPTSRDDTTV